MKHCEAQALHTTVKCDEPLVRESRHTRQAGKSLAGAALPKAAWHAGGSPQGERANKRVRKTRFLRGPRRCGSLIVTPEIFRFLTNLGKGRSQLKPTSRRKGLSRGMGAELGNSDLPRQLHLFLHLVMLRIDSCSSGYASAQSEELRRKTHRLGRERPRFSGFHPPNVPSGRSRPLLWRCQCALSLIFVIGNLYKIPGEFLPQESLCMMGAF